MRGQLDKDQIFEYMLAGNSTFTVENESTGNRLTFKITSIQRATGKPELPQKLWFVKVLNGPDNESNYMFLGSLQVKANPEFQTDEFVYYKHSKKSGATEDATSVKMIEWMVKRLQSKKFGWPENVHVFHEGRCGRCGRKLTVPESITSGYGPECIKFAMAA